MNLRNKAFSLAALAFVSAGLTVGTVDAQIVTTNLSIHYQAGNVDGLGNAGNGSTTTLVNLANPGTHNGTIVNGTGVVQNVAQVGTPFEYGIVLNGSLQTHIAANSFQIAGGTNKVTDATWEFWLRADSGVEQNRGALYGEFEASGTDSRHYLRLEGIGTTSRRASYDEFPPSGGAVTSDSQLFTTATFTQIVVTKSGDTMTFYRDGAQVGSTKTHSETFSSGPITQTLFGQRVGQNESFDGQFNIIRVYDDALNSAQVLGNYNATLIPEPSSLSLMALALGGLYFLRRRQG